MNRIWDFFMCLFSKNPGKNPDDNRNNKNYDKNPESHSGFKNVSYNFTACK